MSQITYETIEIDGVKVNHLRELEIHQKLDEHAIASFTGEISVEAAKDITAHATEKMIVTIKAKAKPLFCGMLSDIAVQYENDYAILVAKLITTTFALDCQVESRSYQNTGAMYSEVMEKSTNARGSINFVTTDKAIGRLIMQYKETSWNFIKRMADECNTFIVPDITAKRPTVIVGKRSGMTYNSEEIKDEVIGINSYCGKTDKFMIAGMKYEEYTIMQVDSIMREGVLETEFIANRKPFDQLQKTTRQPASSGGQFAGKIFMGVVQSVKMDMVQAHLTDVDASYEAGDWWFPYSTVYSSVQNEAGYYCMPKEGDPVRIFFPSEDPKDAFAASSSTVRGNRDNEKEKCFETQSGMQVIFTEEGLFLKCNKKGVYINLKKETGIEINANTAITMNTSKNFAVMAYETLQVKSDQEIFIGTPKTFIGIKKTDGNDANITAYAPNIYLK